MTTTMKMSWNKIRGTLQNLINLKQTSNITFVRSLLRFKYSESNLSDTGYLHTWQCTLTFHILDKTHFVFHSFVNSKARTPLVNYFKLSSLESSTVTNLESESESSAASCGTGFGFVFKCARKSSVRAPRPEILQNGFKYNLGESGEINLTLTDQTQPLLDSKYRTYFGQWP